MARKRVRDDDGGDNHDPPTDPLLDNTGCDSGGHFAWNVAWSSGITQWSSEPLPSAGDAVENFVKGVLWSSDGSFLLTNSEDHTLRLWDLSVPLLPQAWGSLVPGAGDGQSGEEPAQGPLRLMRQYKEGECVYDFCWYPHARRSDPSSCCMLSCSRDNPVHLWHAAPDNFTGSGDAAGSDGGAFEQAGPGHLRASYCAYNHLDEITAALSCCFSADGAKIYCGFERAVRIFHTARPGRDCETRATAKTRGSKEGQKGLISCLAANRDGTIYAAGSYDRTIGLYSAAAGERLALLPASSGVTQVTFAPDGILLLAGERKSTALVGWDIRCTAAPLFTCRRELNTNQHLQFDVDASSLSCATADAQGRVLVYDIREAADAPDEAPPLQAELQLYGDTGAGSNAEAQVVSSVSFHPYLPLLATGSGTRWTGACENLSTSSSDEEGGKDAQLMQVCSSHRNEVAVWRLPWREVAVGEAGE